ncbi:MAG: hypothetical protein LUH02_04830 [Erysipelotrichaceae bacterium]|nr:hypothetical protein [Erysipelotrichaceae bacterium]
MKIEKYNPQSDLGKFKKQLSCQDVTIDEAYRKVLQERFSHGTKLGKKAYVNFVGNDTIESLDYMGIPCYNFAGNKKIKLNSAADIVNPRGVGVTWFHEHGHLIDDALGNILSDYLYEKLLNQDVLDYRISYGRKNKLKNYNQIDLAIGAELNDMRLHSAVSDLMEGLTDGKIVGVSGHGMDYWNYDQTASTDEAFAHMYECQFDNQRYKVMKKYFPRSLKYFEKKLKTMKGRVK